MKYQAKLFWKFCKEGRSREGAWIEIEGGCMPGWDIERGRSREGAWIEIRKKLKNTIEIIRGRSREGAWIEILVEN